MARTAFLIPKEGLIVRDPVSKEILSESGELKPLIGPEGRYWRRRIRDRSVIVSKKAIYAIAEEEPSNKSRVKREVKE